MLKGLGHFVFRHRKAVILVWLVILAVCAFVAPKVSQKLVPGAALPSKCEAAYGYKMLEQELGIKCNTFLLVIRSETLRADDPLFMDQEDEALGGLQGIPELSDPVTYRSTGDPRFISLDGYTTYALIGVDGDDAMACKLVPVVRNGLRQQSDLTVLVTGQAALARDSEAVGVEDMGRAEVYTFPLLAIVLVLVFGSLVAAGLPLAIGGASLAVAMGVVYVMSDFITINSGSLIVVAFLGLGNGVDYALIMVSRFREELQKGRGVEESLAVTCSTSGLAICGAAVTTVIGLAALISFDVSVVRAAGIGGVIVVLLAWLASLTLLPALLAVLGTKVNRLTLFNLAVERGTFWQRLARWEMQHPILVLGILLPLFFLLAWPLLSVNPRNASYSAAPVGMEARQGMEMLMQDFSVAPGSPIQVLVTADGKITDWGNVRNLYDYTRRIALNERVARVDSIVNLDPSITREQYELMYAFPDSIPDPRVKDALDQLTSEHSTLVQVYVSGDPMGKEAREVVSSLRDMDYGGFETYVTGAAAYDQDLTDMLFRQFIRIVPLMMVATYVVLLFVFRSVLLPLKAVVLNCLSVAATFGILIFVFQAGHFSDFLNFTTDGSISPIALIIVFCIVFGISMDYEVFLMTRIREEWENTGDATESVSLGLARTGRIITSSAAVMAVTFGTFLTARLVHVQIVGLGLALAILLDATIIRLFVVPALMRLLGKWNWWIPSFKRRHRRSEEQSGSKEPGRLSPDVAASQYPDAGHS
jgi:RND superfamily putative drug exporter